MLLKILLHVNLIIFLGPLNLVSLTLYQNQDKEKNELFGKPSFILYIQIKYQIKKIINKHLKKTYVI